VWLPDAKPEWGKRFQLSALRDGRWKFVRDFTRDRSTLFDLVADPKELRDVSAEHSDVATSMRATLETWTQEQQNRGGNAERRPIDKDLERKLKELGYL
jgi:arylsulfatase A-like enzyme